MANGKRVDPILSCRFTIEFGSVIAGEFQEVSGLMSQNEPVDYKASGPKGRYINRKLPGNPSYGNITLKRGVTDAMDLWQWREKVEQGKMDEARQNGDLVMYDASGEEVARWTFTDAWPSKITGPSANATANQVAIEEMEIVCEAYTRTK